MSYTFGPNRDSDRSHKELVSVLKRRIPVYRQNHQVKELTDKTLPMYIENGLFTRGSDELAEVSIRNGIQIYPATALSRIERAGDAEKQLYEDCNFIYNTFTDGEPIVKATIRTSRDTKAAKLEDFDLVLFSNGPDKQFQLQGIIVDSPELAQAADRNFEVIAQDAGEDVERYYVDGDFVSKLLIAVLLRLKDSVEIPPTIQDKVLQLTDLSPSLYTNSWQRYELKPHAPASRLTVGLGRRGCLISNDEKMTGYVIEMNESFDLSGHGVTHEETLTLDYTKGLRPAYVATLEATVSDPQQNETIEDRDRYFDNLLKKYHDHPAIFFRTLGSVARRLNKF
ncbi:MAG: hypothetical protein ABI397_00605 [Candidatus Saccharimonas sp.]